jgi:hypothetical protein
MKDSNGIANPKACYNLALGYISGLFKQQIFLPGLTVVKLLLKRAGAR